MPNQCRQQGGSTCILRQKHRPFYGPPMPLHVLTCTCMHTTLHHMPPCSSPAPLQNEVVLSSDANPSLCLGQEVQWSITAYVTTEAVRAEGRGGGVHVWRAAGSERAKNLDSGGKGASCCASWPALPAACPVACESLLPCDPSLKPPHPHHPFPPLSDREMASRRPQAPPCRPAPTLEACTRHWARGPDHVQGPLKVLQPLPEAAAPPTSAAFPLLFLLLAGDLHCTLLSFACSCSFPAQLQARPSLLFRGFGCCSTATHQIHSPFW